MKINFLFTLLICLAFAASSGDVKAWSETVYEATLPFFDYEREIGEVKVLIKNEELMSIDRDQLIQSLAPVLNKDTVEALKKLPSQLTPNDLPFPLQFNVQELKLVTQLSTNIRSRDDIGLRDEFKGSTTDALKPSPFGGAINYRLENSWGDKELGANGVSGQFNSFINLQGVVLENQSFYQQNNRYGSEWFRGDTRLVKDFEQHEIRTQAGDIYPQVQGFMVGRPMGGLNIQKNFTLNPYRLPFPTGTQDFTLKSRSLVKYFVNNILVKTEYLPAGNYTAKDIPLNNGLNTILIEATDELGEKQVFVFRSSASINLLNQGEGRFDFSYGVPFMDNPDKRTYRYQEGKVFSGFYQYGISSELSASLYLQNQQDFNLLGAEVIQATPIGNFSYGHAQSSSAAVNGSANGASYQFVNQGKRWYQSHSVGLRYENRGQDFRSTLFDVASVVQNNYAATYTMPVASAFTFSVGGNFGDVRDNKLNDRYGFDSTINFRLFSHHNLSVFVSRNRDEFKRWNDVAYFFLTITFPERNDFVSALYDQQLKSSRLTYLKDNQNRLRDIRMQASLQHSETTESGELDMTYPTHLGDLGGRISAQKINHEDRTLGRGTLRLNSAVVFAYDNDHWGLGISRPIPGSFVLFKPEENLKDQQIALKSTSPYSEAETGLFGEITYTSLLAYQYRDIQLDPSFLEDGTTLSQEKYNFYPTYRSAHLVSLQGKGTVVVKGKLVDDQGAPIALAVGKVGPQIFFTNREGYFFVEGLEAGKHILKLDEREEELLIIIGNKERGLKDMGTLQFEVNP